VPIDREGADRRALTDALALLARGEGLLVFPEGTRIRRPGLAEPKAGIGLLAVRSVVPVVPAYITSNWEPRRRWYRRIPVRIRFGAPLRFTAAGTGASARERYDEAAEAIMRAIAALGPDSGSPGPGRA
jgi:1-acyl-sn-glycerol-3-phosphate acyltransferase